MKIYNLLYFNLLCKYLTDLLTNQVYESLLLIIIKNEKKWELKNIFNVNSHYSKLQYQVK